MKIVQLAVIGDSLYALDESGILWRAQTVALQIRNTGKVRWEKVVSVFPEED